MMDQPSALELVTAVKEFIEKHAMPQLSGHTAFHARVAANEAMLGISGSLEELNRELCRRIRSGELGVEAPGLSGHMRATTMDKVGIDQPTYSGFKAAQKKES